MDLLLEIAVISTQTSRRILELGALSGLVGGLLLAFAGLRPSFQKTGLLVGGLLLVVAFVLVIIAYHWGFQSMGR